MHFALDVKKASGPQAPKSEMRRGSYVYFKSKKLSPQSPKLYQTKPERILFCKRQKTFFEQNNGASDFFRGPPGPSERPHVGFKTCLFVIPKEHGSKQVLENIGLNHRQRCLASDEGSLHLETVTNPKNMQGNLSLPFGWSRRCR